MPGGVEKDQVPGEHARFKANGGQMQCAQGINQGFSLDSLNSEDKIGEFAMWIVLDTRKLGDQHGSYYQTQRKNM